MARTSRLTQWTHLHFAHKALRALRDEHGHRVRHVLRSQSFRGVLGAAGELRRDASGANHADANPVVPKILSHASRQSLQAPLGSAIDSAARERVPPGQGTDVYDVSTP